MQFKFLGVRGSISAPDRDRTDIGCNTTGVVLLKQDGKRLFIDLGSGIVKFNQYYMHNPQDNEINLLLTHTHIDHIIGFPFFAPIFNKNYVLNIYAPNIKKISTEKIFQNLMATPFFPVNLKELKAKINFNFIKEKTELNINGFKVKAMRHYHPLLCYGYRIEADNKTFVFSTDTEHPEKIDNRVVELSKDADVLVHDSQYFPEELKSHLHWGHSSYKEAIEIKTRANAKKLYLFHHDPLRSDKQMKKMLKEARKLDKSVHIAKEKENYTKI